MKPKLYEGSCASCGVAFFTSHCYRLYCGDRCRQRAHRRRAQNHRAVTLNRPRLPMAQGLEVRKWKGQPIQRRQADGFVNATAMAKANGKHLPHFLANERTRAYITALAAVVGIPTTEIVQTRQGGTPSEQGTWIHPRLAIDLARWLSPQFAVWMDGWFLESLHQPPVAQVEQLQLPAASPAAELLHDLPIWDLPSDLGNWFAALDTLDGAEDLEVRARASMIRGHLLMAEAGLTRLRP